MKHWVPSKALVSGRRVFLKQLLGTAAGWMVLPLIRAAQEGYWVTPPKSPFLFSILDESFHELLRSGDPGALLRVPRLVREWFECDAVELCTRYFPGDRRQAVELARALLDAAATSRVQFLVLTLADRAPGEKSLEADWRGSLGFWGELARLLKCHSLRIRLKKEGQVDQKAERIDFVLQSAQFLARCGMGLLVEPAEVQQLLDLQKSLPAAKVANLGISMRLDYRSVQNDERQRLLRVLRTIREVKAVTLVWRPEYQVDGIQCQWYRQALQEIVLGGFRGYVGLLWLGPLQSPPEQLVRFSRWLLRLRDELKEGS